MTSYSSLAEQLRLLPDSARRAMVELHQARWVKLYRYFHSHLHEQATFHLVLIGDCEGADRPRPKVIVDVCRQGSGAYPHNGGSRASDLGGRRGGVVMRVCPGSEDGGIGVVFTWPRAR